jgi:hypothetical protein
MKSLDSSATTQPVSAPSVTAGAWNPRYLNYASSQARSPEAQIEHDRTEFPGGPGAGFILWNRARLREYSKVNPAAFISGGLRDHAGYDTWLSAHVASESRS